MWKYIEIKSIPEEHDKVEKEILKALNNISCAEHDIFSVRLALEEAVMNAIKHGNKLDAHKKVRISYRLIDKKIEITVEDEGNGFDPIKIPDCTRDDRLELPFGRGLFLMRTYMDKVDFNEAGNKVMMSKMIS